MKSFARRKLVLSIGLLASMAVAQTPELVVQTGHTVQLDYLDLPRGYIYYAKINALAISGNDRLLASASDDFTIKLWDLATGKELRTLIGHSDSVRTLAFSPDGKMLASGGDEVGIILWEVATGKQIRTLGKDQSAPDDYRARMEHEFMSVVFSPDGRTLAAQSQYAVIRLWNIASGEEVTTFPEESIIPNDFLGRSTGRISFASQGRAVASAYSLWDTATARALRPPLPPERRDIHAACFGPDGKIMGVSRTDGVITLVSVATGAQIWSVQAPSPQITTVECSGDGRVLASADIAGNILIRDAATGNKLHALKTANESKIQSLAFSSDGRILVSGSDDGSIFVWDVASGVARPLKGSADVIWGVYANTKGDLLASGNAKGIKIWGLSTGQVLRDLDPAAKIRAMAFFPGEDTLATGTKDGQVTFWDAASGSQVDSFKDRGGIDAMAFRPASKDLATLVKFQGEPHLQVWDLSARNIVWEWWWYSVGSGMRNATAFSPDGSALADGNTHVKLWKLPLGNKPQELEGHKGALDTLAFSFDNKILATGSRDETIKLWDVETGNEIRTLSGHDSFVKALAFSPDGKTLASGGLDGTVKIWDINTGQILQTQSTLVYQLHSVIFSPDGTLLTVAGVNRIQLWRVAQDHSLKQLCTLFSFVDGGWAVVDPDGRFDTDNLDQISGLNWVFPDEPFRALAPEIFMRDYYQPKLLPKLLGGEKLPQVRSLAELNRVQPRVEVLNVEPEDTEGMVSVTVRVTSDQSAMQKDKSGNLLQSNAYDLRLFRDRQLVGQCPEGGTAPAGLRGLPESELESWRALHQMHLVEGQSTCTLSHIRLPQRGAGSVEFTAYAFNSDRVKSATASYEYKLPLAKRTPGTIRRAYLITMGVNANQSRWNLELAVSSAERARHLLRDELQRQYQEIIEIPLYSDLAKNGVQVISKRADKAYLQAALDLLAGRPVPLLLRDEIDKEHKLRAATPDDAVVLYIASHGYADPQGNFYVVPYDTGSSWGVTEEVLNGCYGKSATTSAGCQPALDFLGHTISSANLAAWWRGVDAGEMVMILDSCHSGAVPGRQFRPGPLGDPGFGQLSYDKAMRILCAAQPAQTEQGDWMGDGEGRTLLVAALEVAARANPGQSLGEWLKDTERQLPVRMKQLYPQIKAGEEQLPELLDFSRSAR